MIAKSNKNFNIHDTKLGKYVKIKDYTGPFFYVLLVSSKGVDTITKTTYIAVKCK